MKLKSTLLLVIALLASAAPSWAHGGTFYHHNFYGRDFYHHRFYGYQPIIVEQPLVVAPVASLVAAEPAPQHIPHMLVQEYNWRR